NRGAAVALASPRPGVERGDGLGADADGIEADGFEADEFEAAGLGAAGLETDGSDSESGVEPVPRRHRTRHRPAGSSHPAGPSRPTGPVRSVGSYDGIGSGGISTKISPPSRASSRNGNESPLQ